MGRLKFVLQTCLVLSLIGTSVASAQTYTCSQHKKSMDEIQLAPQDTYSGASAGFDLAPSPSLVKNACTAERDFFFSASMPEGSYTVSVTLGGPAAAITTVRAEARRLMLRKVSTAAGGERIESFTVNVRRPAITPGGQEVKRKPRELHSLNWDGKLTLEFAGDHPSVRKISIAPANKSLPTVYLAGDSTVVDQDNEPWAAWGQMLPSFFGPGVSIANNAESGETIRSFVGERRFDKIFSTIHAGDFLLMQFGHNDQKPGSGNVSTQDYAALLRKYIAMAREKGATPVLVTSMNRRTYDAVGHITDTLAPYPQVVRDVASSENVGLIDLNTLSKTLYEAVGEAKSRSMFVYADANTYPNQAEALHDDTHFNSYGAYELARCVVLGMQQAQLPLVKLLREPNIRFDPAHPDEPGAVALPVTPFFDLEKPYER
ncbi:rhamnogalacturonan acetylesterase [Terriglobus roseus]|uniref:Lysophospholipase L1 n=1 Tax=Terriglobus roseus TaxID=392734 RepID=A0A1H4SGR2_9BACT|nr:rhamnogalacturonan acetylesterase [Terriglobus roseus]SEC43250.1 Lysophospholipase L1 [Terriglobus roseus]